MTESALTDIVVSHYRSETGRPCWSPDCESAGDNNAVALIDDHPFTLSTCRRHLPDAMHMLVSSAAYYAGL